MVKKKKKTSRKTKKTIKKRTPQPKIQVKHERDIHVEKVLIENFVALQKVMVDLSSKFEDLSINIKKLLDLFENAAKSLVKDGPDPQSTKQEAESILKKLDGLADQNKIIARGLTLIHEKSPVQQKEPYPPQQRMAPQSMNQSKTIPSTEQKGTDFGGYQKSISEI